MLEKLKRKMVLKSNISVLVEEDTYKVISTNNEVPFAFVSKKIIEINELDSMIIKYPSVSLLIINDENMDVYFINNNKLERINEKYLISKDNSTFMVDHNNFEKFLFNLHSIVRDLDGIHADLVLDELCKIIYSKIYDEINGDKIFNIKNLNKFEFYSVVQNLYFEACKKNSIEGYEKISLSPSCLFELGLRIEKVNFYSLSFDLKGRMFQNLISSAMRAGMGQYFTPHEVISFIVDCIGVKEYESIIDPFCGSGHFLLESARYLDKFNDRCYLSEKLFGIEKNKKIYRIAITDSVFNTKGGININHSDSLLDFDNYNINYKESFDIVMTNPPFGSLLSGDSVFNIGNFELLNGRQSIPLEILGLERSVELIKDGGRLGIVLPDSILTNKSNSYVRAWISNNIKIRGIISLPIETFSPYGANVKTSIILATKNKLSENDNIFMGGVENIGYDASGRKRKTSDLKAISTKFKEFILQEGW
ncbi:TPA: HsdM family class I SAM-dependent methyltransferase [Photobacterium damselae]